MSHTFDATSLRRLAFLYLTMAHRSDHGLSDAELASITRMICMRSRRDDEEEVRQIVRLALDDYQSTDEVDAEARLIAEAMAGYLDQEQKLEILEDLRDLAELDGVVQKNEQGMIAALAAAWDLPRDARDPSIADGSWGVLHHLAYIFLVLAHGTDDELSDQEMQVIFNKLHEWQPEISPDEIESVLKAAMSLYAKGDHSDYLDAAIDSVRDGLPREQRMAALNDLVKIANADGVFLDDEEDLINHLVHAWDVDPFANYGPHGSKV